MAAVAKLGDRAGTGQAALEFGAPAPLAAPLALFIPVAELAVAGLLLPATTALAGAAGAAGLLVIFSAAIGVNLARGRTPECHCFGQLHSAPAGWQTLVRNAALFGVAAATVAGGIARHELSAVAWIGRLEGAELLALVAGAAAVLLLGLGGAAFFSVLRSYGRVLIRLDRIEQRLAEAGINVDEAELPPELGLEPGTPAPVFTTSDAAGKTVSLEDLVRPALPVLLVFTSPHCGPCKALLPAAARWQREHAPELTVAFASEGTYEAVRAEAEEFELERVLVDADRRLYEAFQANGTPQAATGSSSSSPVHSRRRAQLLGFRSARKRRPSSFALWRAARWHWPTSKDGTRSSSFGTRAVASVARCTKTSSPGRGQPTGELRSSSSFRPGTSRAPGRTASVLWCSLTSSLPPVMRSAQTARRWRSYWAQKAESPPVSP